MPLLAPAHRWLTGTALVRHQSPPRTPPNWAILAHPVAPSCSSSPNIHLLRLSPNTPSSHHHVTAKPRERTALSFLRASFTCPFPLPSSPPLPVDLTGQIRRGWYPATVVRRPFQSSFCKRFNCPTLAYEGPGTGGVFTRAGRPVDSGSSGTEKDGARKAGMGR